MLGRVFEGVMAPDTRRSSGTYYTPSSLVGSVLEAALVAIVAGGCVCAEAEAERRLTDGAVEVRRLLRGITLLDPASGSGAFLLSALERLTNVAGDRGVRRSPPDPGAQPVGVDRNPAAVRLTELRSGSQWSQATRPRIRPRSSHSPTSIASSAREIRCSIRWAAGFGRLPVQWPPSSLASGGQVVVSSGPDKRRLVRELTGLEARVAERTLEEAEDRAEQA
jgi:hypothetical protein